MGWLSEVHVPLSENQVSSYVIKMMALRILKISDGVNINRMSYQFIFSPETKEVLFSYLGP